MDAEGPRQETRRISRRSLLERAAVGGVALSLPAVLSGIESAAAQTTDGPHLGEIRMFGGNFAPAGWAFCNGQLLPISENDALFTLIGTTYGGDGQETFALPNLQSRVPVHQGNGFVMGQAAGVESVTLTTQQVPVHTHPFLGSQNQGSTTNPPSNVVGGIPGGGSVYIQDQTGVALNSQSLQAVGGSQPHDNLQPYLCVSFIISLFGVFPTQV
jgi:microcystin-dependent protein